MAEQRNVSGAFSSGISSSASTALGVKSTIKEGAMTLSTQLSMLGLDTASIFTNEDQYKELANAAGNAALDYLNTKIDRIKNAWNTKVDISVKALIGEAAPYVLNFGDASKLLVSKIDNFVAYILGVDADGWGSILDELGSDAINYMASDPALQSTMSNLSVIKVMGDAFAAYDTVSKTVSKVLNIVEPLIPMLQIVTNLILSFRTGGASTAEAAQEITEQAQVACQKLLSLAIAALRKYVYNIKIKVPALFVGALNSVSVREAMISDSEMDGWLQAIFSEEFYQNTLYSLQWQDAINQAIQTTLGSASSAVNDWSSFNFKDKDGNPLLRGEFMKTKFMSTLTSRFLKEAVAAARKTAYIRSFDNTNWKTKGDYDNSGARYDEDSQDKTTASGNKKSKLDILLENDGSKEMSPVTNLNSIRIVSKQLLTDL